MVTSLPENDSRPRWTRWGWALAGVGLIAIHGVLLGISPQFAYGRLPVLQRPTGLAVTLMMLAGAVYLATIWLLRTPVRPSRGWWLWVLGCGLAMRGLMIPSTPILETDYFRYLWDGAVLANGYSPYAHSPAAVLAQDAPARLVELGQASDRVLEQVNHPWLTTIYWWNPLLIKEGYNAAHMEMTLLPLVVAALWLAVRRRPVASGTMLALAVGAKLWPVLLLPALLRQRRANWKRIGIAVAVFALFSGAIVSPMFLTTFGETAGLRAYAATWQMNDTLYQGFHRLARWLDGDHAHRIARLMIGCVLLGWIGWLCRRRAEDGRAICERALWIVAALFLLSPTQYPWYWLWLLPMLAIRPSPGLLVLTATLPLYYLRFPMRELGYITWFDHGFVWLQFAPAFVLLAREAWQRRAHEPQLKDVAGHES